MTPRQALMWFIVILVVVGAVYTIVAYLITKNFDSTLPGLLILVLGLALGFIAKKIRWS